jgi:hypothetical protein
MDAGGEVLDGLALTEDYYDGSEAEHYPRF